MVHSTDIVEFELRSKKFSLAVRKKEALVQPEPMYLPVQAMLPMLSTFHLGWHLHDKCSIPLHVLVFHVPVLDCRCWLQTRGLIVHYLRSS